MAPVEMSAVPLDPADKRKALPVVKLCARCKKNRSTIVLQSATYCHECALFNFEGKLRMGLEQARLCAYLHRQETEERADSSSSSSPSPSQHPVSSSNTHLHYPSQGRVALAFSGGAASRSLLHCAKARLAPKHQQQHDRKNTKSNEICAIDIIYVDDSEVVEGATDRTEEIRAIIEEEEGGVAEGLHFRPLKLRDAFEGEEGAVACTSEAAASRYLSTEATPIKSKGDCLKQLFASIQPSFTPKSMLANARSRSEDLVSLLTIHLLRREAIRLGATCLLTGETSTRMAIKLIESIGKGRGHKLPIEQGSIRWNGLFILRPLRDLTAKEVALYIRAKQLTSLTPQDLVASQLLSNTSSVDVQQQEGSNGDKASVNRLTESLIHLLEKGVPSTVSTINKAGDKLVFSNDIASHGYDDNSYGNEGPTDNSNIDANTSSSSSAFHQVGPSVPLRLRKRQDSASTQMSQRSLTPTATNTLNSAMTTNGGGGKGDRTLSGQGLGRMGSSLYFAAKSMLPYNGALACPLCEMPSQRGLHSWKRGLTIRSLDGEDETQKEKGPNGRGEDKIDLSNLLCYACLIVLDTPEGTKEGATMPLPSFVLHGAQRRVKEAESHLPNLVDDEETGEVENQANGDADLTGELPKAKTVKENCVSTASRHQERHRLQKVDREEMKSHLNAYLLREDEEEEAKGQKSSERERFKTDW